MSAICQCGQMGGVTHSCISPSYSGQTAPLYTKKIISQSGGTMNTHKEELSNCCSAKPCGEIAYDNSGRCGDCKEGCMFTEECDTSCGINADPADGFGKCTCGAELAEPTPPSQIEEDPFDFVEPCEPDCTPERHSYHQGQWDMAIRINKKHGYRGYPGAVEDEEPWQYVNNTK